MGISVLKLDSDAVDIRTTDLALHVVLADGRELAAPLEWFPRLDVPAPLSETAKLLPRDALPTVVMGAMKVINHHK